LSDRATFWFSGKRLASWFKTASARSASPASAANAIVRCGSFPNRRRAFVRSAWWRRRNHVCWNSPGFSSSSCLVRAARRTCRHSVQSGAFSRTCWERNTASLQFRRCKARFPRSNHSRHIGSMPALAGAGSRAAPAAEPGPASFEFTAQQGDEAEIIGENDWKGFSNCLVHAANWRNFHWACAPGKTALRHNLYYQLTPRARPHMDGNEPAPATAGAQ
jgi:hypothetical protein